MRFIDFQLNIEVVIGDSKDVGEVVKFINERVERAIAQGVIIECNTPSWIVYYNILKKQMVILPGDWLTLYMSKTMSYDLGNTVQYDRFKFNLQNEIDFRKLLDIEHKHNMFIHRLYSNTEVPSLHNYSQEFGFPHVKSSRLDDLVTMLGYEFLLTNHNTYIFDEYKKNVYNLIDKMNSILYMSDGVLDGHIVWNKVFNRYIRYIGIKDYYSKCRNNKFYSIGDIYKNIMKNSSKREEFTNNYTKPPIKKERVLTDREKMLMFMGLSNKFNKKQLKKRFRKLALEYHPDKKGGDSTKFVYLKECFETLSITT